MMPINNGVQNDDGEIAGTDVKVTSESLLGRERRAKRLSLRAGPLQCDQIKIAKCL